MTHIPSDKSEMGFTCPTSRGEFCKDLAERVGRIGKELSEGLTFVTDYQKSVTFFGSSRFASDNPHAKKAERLAGRVARELGYAVVTGGSAGIMEAANKGAFEAGGKSVGLNITLPKEQGGNNYTTAAMNFSHFFVRKVALSYAAEAYIFFPGGFGTLDEFFEIITLVQTHKIRRVPLFLVGDDYWSPLDAFIRENLCRIHQAIGKGDLDLYTVTEDEDKIIAAIRSEPIHDGAHPTKHAK